MTSTIHRILDRRLQRSPRRRVRIGDGVTILAGVTVGDGAVVAAGAVR